MKINKKFQELLWEAGSEIEDNMFVKLNEYYTEKPIYVDEYPTFLDYIQHYTVEHHNIEGIPDIKEEVLRVIKKNWKALSKGEQFAYMTYIKESNDPMAKTLTAPPLNEIYMHFMMTWLIMLDLCYQGIFLPNYKKSIKWFVYEGI